ncbi:MAG: 30S ribosomal protein THX [Rickettsiales bacterium]|nr:30S ribosomal protein THX [Rickettsiales bacterium]
MGKGDVKTKKGKISNGSYGVKRPKKATPKKAVSTKKK